ncbi:bis(5'-nucleosyl)-tetraphosphatase (symmetrical) YqeK [Anthocerotibacter panamensis]|uniref:bis(5'-nucleosyl)-tetraphosphatase (symmetrical) YqeK n=1 Tax=Anthocerotibacter panamensis TaxID=2857077 RepID=UPI001C408844|nr:bis(5'-nucleosyl)-tetraphosphatase (symmetrical) YqeK [Anthocerotibacter panamensis]
MREQVLDWLKVQVPRKRLQHILGVEKTAAQMAYHYGLDIQKAARAGLLHDLAKCFSSEQLLGEALRFGIELDDVTRANPHLLHAEVGAGLARELFAEEDPQVLAAIANHTLGRPAMDDLSCILYVADWIEPTRLAPELNELRTLAFQDLHRAVLLGCRLSVADLLVEERPIHPRTILTRNWLLSQAPVGVA